MAPAMPFSRQLRLPFNDRTAGPPRRPDAPTAGTDAVPRGLRVAGARTPLPAAPDLSARITRVALSLENRA